MVLHIFRYMHTYTPADMFFSDIFDDLFCAVQVVLHILRAEATGDLVQARDRPFYGDRMPYHQPFGTQLRQCVSNAAETVARQIH